MTTENKMYYYCNTCKRKIKNPNLHNKKTKGIHDIRIRGFMVCGVQLSNLISDRLKEIVGFALEDSHEADYKFEELEE
jgi:hypothetical protein